MRREEGREAKDRQWKVGWKGEKGEGRNIKWREGEREKGQGRREGWRREGNKGMK